MINLDKGLDALEEQFVKEFRNEIQVFYSEASKGNPQALYDLAGLILDNCPSSRFEMDALKMLKDAALGGHEEAKTKLATLDTDLDTEDLEIGPIQRTPDAEVGDPKAISPYPSLQNSDEIAREQIAKTLDNNVPTYAIDVIMDHLGEDKQVYFFFNSSDSRFVVFLVTVLLVLFAPLFSSFFGGIIMVVSALARVGEWNVLPNMFSPLQRVLLAESSLAGITRFGGIIGVLLLLIPFWAIINRTKRDLVVCKGLLFVFPWNSAIAMEFLAPNDISHIELKGSTVKLFAVAKDGIKPRKLLHTRIPKKLKREFVESLYKADFSRIKVQ